MKQVVLTGSTSGIGRAIAEHLLAQGIEVIGVARDHSKVAAFDAGYYAHAIDLAEQKGLESKFKAIRATYADIDTLICCSGYGRFVELEQFSYTEMDKMLRVNFLSQALLVKILLPQLKQQSNAKIIFMGSEAALTGQKKGSMYCASKFALRGFAQSLRQECRTSDVAVSIVNPGMVDTAFFDTLNFKPGSEKQHSIGVWQIVDIVDMILNMKNNCVLDEVNCQPITKVIAKA